MKNRLEEESEMEKEDTEKSDRRSNGYCNSSYLKSMSTIYDNR